MSGSLFSSLEQQYGLPAGTLNTVYGIESNYGQNNGPSSSGAIGPFQFLPSTFSQFNSDPSQAWQLQPSATAAAQYLSQIYQQYGNNYGAMLAGYNAGPNSSAVAQYAATGNTSVLPQQTQNYLAQAASLNGGTLPTGASGSASSPGAAAGASGASGSTGSIFSPSTWFSALGGWISHIAARGGLFLLGVVFVIGALGLFALKTGIQIETSSTKAGTLE